MEIRTLESYNNEAIADEAAAVLREGGIVVVPTDTVYGILADAKNRAAIEKIFDVKKRQKKKALSIFVPTIAVARAYAYISDAKARFLESVWPGQVTILFYHKEKLPKSLTSMTDKIAIRVPDYPFLSLLFKRFDAPLAQTSANMSGFPPAKNRAEIEAYFKEAEVAPDLVIDGGELYGKASTLIDFTLARPRLLRTGLISKSELDALLHSISE